MKEQLAALINAYSAARMTQDPLLVEMAGTRLNNFLEGVELTAITNEDSSDDA